MPVVFLITIVAVLVGIFFVATGRGGELAYEHADHAPLDLGPVSAADIALLRPPTAMWGYNMQVTDEALDRIARAMRDRDVTIAFLQEQLAALTRNGSYAEPRGAYATRRLWHRESRRSPKPARALRPLRSGGSREPGVSSSPAGPLSIAEAPEILESPRAPLGCRHRRGSRGPGVSSRPAWAAEHRGGSRDRRYSRRRRSGGGSPGFRVRL